jgi:peptidoglycan hydrolase-like protein with peptidoglycan-binding domain
MHCGLMVITLALGAHWAAPAAADDNVFCVQQQLAARGVNPGPADGELGARTRAAAESYAEAERLPLPTLTVATAGDWCAALRVPRVVTSTFAAAPRDPQRPRGCAAYVIDPEDECY